VILPPNLTFASPAVTTNAVANTVTNATRVALVTVLATALVVTAGEAKVR